MPVLTRIQSIMSVVLALAPPLAYAGPISELFRTKCSDLDRARPFLEESDGQFMSVVDSDGNADKAFHSTNLTQTNTGRWEKVICQTLDLRSDEERYKACGLETITAWPGEFRSEQWSVFAEYSAGASFRTVRVARKAGKSFLQVVNNFCTPYTCSSDFQISSWNSILCRNDSVVLYQPSGINNASEASSVLAGLEKKYGSPRKIEVPAEGWFLRYSDADGYWVIAFGPGDFGSGQRLIGASVIYVRKDLVGLFERSLEMVRAEETEKNATAVKKTVH